MKENSEAELKECLLKLCEAIDSNIDEYQRTGLIVKNKIPYPAPEIDFYSYDNHYVNLGFNQNNIIEELEITDIIKLYNLIEEYPVYSRCLDLLTQFYLKHFNDKNSLQESIYLIQRIIGVVATKSYEGSIGNLVSNFVTEITKIKTDYKVKIYLYGVVPDADYNLGSFSEFQDVILRKPSEADLTNISYMKYSRVDTLQEDFIIEHCTAILEFTLIGSAPEQESYGIDQEIDIILDIFRLLKLGRVFYLKYEFFPVSIDKSYALRSYIHKQINATLAYGFNINDVDGFKTLCDVLRKLIPASYVLDHVTKELSNVEISFRWYKDALMEYSIFENKMIFGIASSIISLESLYLNENDELSHKLALRASALLGMFGKTPLIVFRDIKDAYNIRSDVFHGSSLFVDKKDLKTIQKSGYLTLKEFYEVMLEYNRLSLLLIFQISKNYDKGKFIKNLDNYLIDDQIRIIFKKEILSTCHIL